MEEVKKGVAEILDQFFKEEYNNRLSQFSFVTLKNMIMIELGKYVEINNVEINNKEDNHR